MTHYVDVARSLPRPTEEQTRAFARFITGAHSWYKHLPVLEDCPFYFYLDPHAGCDLIQESEDEYRFCEKTEDTLKFHYTWQTTASYRRRFGYWNYAQSYGLRFAVTTEDYTLDPDGEPLQIGVPEIGWIEVPERLKAAGCAHVNALMYDEIGFLEERSETMRDADWENLGCFGYVETPPSLMTGYPRVLFHARREADLEQPEEAIAKLPPAISEALVPMIAFWNSDAYQQEVRDTGKALKEYLDVEVRRLRKKKPSDDETPRQDPFKSDTYLLLRESTRSQWEQTPVRKQERTLLAPLIAAISAERQRQIDEMANAMRRFLEALEASE